MIRPIGNRLLLKRLPLPDKSEGGLYLLGREYPLMGEVLAIGNGSLPNNPRKGTGRIKMVEMSDGTILVGDIIYFHKEAIRQGRGELGYDDLVIVDAEHCLARVRD